jgi:NADP-dependent 3-hydroxy acid dehydrogenase YdfG
MLVGGVVRRAPYDRSVTRTRTAVITGASAGIGAATAQHLVQAGFNVIIGARRKDRLEEVAAETGATAIVLDVTDQASVDAFCAQVPECGVLVNNAGGALGLSSIADGKDTEWLEMYERNVMSVLRMSRALLPKLIASGNGHIVNIGSVAGIFHYAGGGGYVAAKHAERAVTKTLRGELVEQPVRVTEIQPGMVQTEFSLVRFDGDAQKAAAVYEGVEALTAGDIADCVAWAVTRPPHVNVDEMMVTPQKQILGFGQHVVRGGV